MQKSTIWTYHHIVEQVDNHWIPHVKDWRLNENPINHFYIEDVFYKDHPKLSVKNDEEILRCEKEENVISFWENSASREILNNKRVLIVSNEVTLRLLFKRLLKI